jgi:uncharacterized protein with von Willebrand factor type A (vWA) domain
MEWSVEVGSILMVVFAAWGGLWGIASKIRKEREAEAAKTLKAAKEEDAKIKAEMEAKIRLLEEKLKNLEHDTNKDFDHLKETHGSALANLGQKIEELRDQLNAQHAQLLSFLTKLIEKR